MKKTVFALFAFFTLTSHAQSELTSGYFNYTLTDRYEILSGTLSEDFFTGTKPYRRDAVASFAEKVKPISKVDSFNQNYLLRDNILYTSRLPFNRKPILNYFFPTESALTLVKEDRFKLVMNPVLGFAGGSDSGDSLSTYRNSRGFELHGNIGNKVGFYTYALENQARFPNFLRDKYANDFSVAGATLAKPYGNSARDFFNIAGYVTASPIKEITLQFGHDRNFIGNGYRSMILSDYATPSTFLKINTKVWKLNYMNLYSVHTDHQGYNEKAPTKRKFSALHHLSVNVGKNLTLGLWENIIFDRQDSMESGRYEIDYMNPIIFYRAVEHGLNSSDNVLLGMDWKWNFLHRFSFYGQFVLDEFVKDAFLGNPDQYVNKWAYQAGLKYVNIAGIKNLDIQLEVNQARPHIYQHTSRSQNWIHYNQSLTHPLGANFREGIAILRFQPLPRLNITAIYSSSKQGIDTNRLTANFGGDITRSTSDKLYTSEAALFQGIENRVSNISLDASYMLWHNLFLDGGIFIRNQSNSLLAADRRNVIFRFGMRLNLAPVNYRQ